MVACAAANGHEESAVTGNIRVGTSGWSYDDWVGSFNPAGVAKADYLGWYAGTYDVVEVDSTFYRPPSENMVRGWAARTPAQFAFALKMPRTITHDKVLTDCEAEMEQLLAALAPLGPKLRTVLLQFGYFNRQAFPSARPFFDRLAAFCQRYGGQVPLTCEIRNRNWLTADYFELLRAHGVAAALVEQAWLPPIDALVEQFDVLTAPWSYVRLIGDREAIEKLTTKWERLVVDRTADLRRVAGALRRIAARAEVLVFVNNHYAGHGPACCQALQAALAAPDAP
jgi:uncharacterized protein YecE (DUF72 family)